MDILRTIITAITTSAISSGIFVYILRTWISERLKQSIKYEYDQKLELLRNDLTLKAKIHEIEMLNLQDKLGNTINEVNDELWKFQDTVIKHVSIFQGQEYKDPNRIKDVYKSYNDFILKFRKNRIFLPTNIVDIIEKFIQELRKYSFEFQTKVVFEKDQINQIENWHSISEFVIKRCDEVRNEIESYFRKIMGVDKLSV